MRLAGVEPVREPAAGEAEDVLGPRRGHGDLDAALAEHLGGVDEGVNGQHVDRVHLLQVEDGPSPVADARQLLTHTSDVRRANVARKYEDSVSRHGGPASV